MPARFRRQRFQRQLVAKHEKRLRRIAEQVEEFTLRRSGVDVAAIDQHLPLDPRARNDVVHAGERTQKRRLAAAGRSNERRHLLRMHLQVDLFEHAIRDSLNKTAPRRMAVLRPPG